MIKLTFFYLLNVCTFDRSYSNNDIIDRCAHPKQMNEKKNCASFKTNSKRIFRHLNNNNNVKGKNSLNRCLNGKLNH